jgi:hypothetical protein
MERDLARVLERMLANQQLLLEVASGALMQLGENPTPDVGRLLLQLADAIGRTTAAREELRER